MIISSRQTDSSLLIEQRADKNEYADAELVSIKTKLNLPYYTGDGEFERAYGSIRVAGVDYDYVKRRIFKDTLELLCLPNTVKTDLQKKSNEIAKTAATGGTSSPSGSTQVVKLTLPDFFQTLTIAVPTGAVCLKEKHFLSDIVFAASAFSLRPDRPPQSI